LQFEIGIQSLNPEVQKTISRRQDTGKAQANLQWLVAHSKAHLHTDLIFGLPGESWDSFAAGFDALWSWGPHEIQLGLLKRLRGTPLAMTAGQDMVFQDLPPYSVVQTDALTRDQVDRFVRLARYWDLVANSGRFARTLPLLLAGTSAFAGLARFTDWFWARTGSTSGITPEMLVDALFDFLTESCGIDASKVRAALLADYRASGARAKPHALRLEMTRAKSAQSASKDSTNKHSARQNRHLAGLAPNR
jgi:hypothetical protein